jgi:hypothetical protein
VVSSDVELPGLAPHVGGAPADIRLVTAGASPPRSTSTGIASDIELRRDPTGWRLSWPDGPTVGFDPEAGRIDLLERAPGDLWCLIGPCLGLALRLRGNLALHASAVATPAGAVAFVGATGSGKSSLALRLVSRTDARFLTDDVLALERTAERWSVFPGVAIAALCEIPPGLEPGLRVIGERDGKAIVALHDPSGADGDLPLKAIWLLELGGSNRLRLGPPLRGAAAAARLLPLLFGERLLPLELRSAELPALCDLVEQVPILPVDLPADPELAAEQVARELAAG